MSTVGLLLVSDGMSLELRTSGPGSPMRRDWKWSSVTDEGAVEMRLASNDIGVRGEGKADEGECVLDVFIYRSDEVALISLIMPSKLSASTLCTMVVHTFKFGVSKHSETRGDFLNDLVYVSLWKPNHTCSSMKYRTDSLLANLHYATCRT